MLQDKFLYIFVAISFIVVIFPNNAQAQTWQSMNGPADSEPGFTHDFNAGLLIQNDTLFYVPPEGAIFKRHVSDDAWTIVTTHNPSSYKAFAVDENGKRYSVNHEVVFPTEPPFSVQDLLFAFSYNSLWTTIQDLSDKDINDITITNNGAALFGGNGIYRLSETNEELAPIDTFVGVSEFYHYEDTLLAAGNGIAYSTDSGETWIQQDEEPHLIRSIASLGQTIVAVTAIQVFVKENLQSDVTAFSDSYEHLNFTLHVADGDLLLGTDSGIFSVDPVAESLTQMFTDLSERSIYSMASSGQSLSVSTDLGMYHCSMTDENCLFDPAPATSVDLVAFQDGAGVLAANRRQVTLYHEQQQEWQLISDEIGGRPGNLYPVNSDIFLVTAGNNLYNCSLQESACEESANPNPGNPILQITETPGGSIVLATSGRVFMADDQNLEWEEVYLRPDEDGTEIRTLLAVDDNTLLIARQDLLIRYSISDNDYEAIEYIEGFYREMRKYSGEILFASDGSSLFTSDDEGLTWNRILDFFGQHNIPGSLRNLLIDENADKIYLVFSEAYILVSDDGGENWGIENSLYPLRIDDVSTGSNGELYLATAGAGVFKNSQPLNPPITISNEEEPVAETPNKFSLYQNYPNPFNPGTVIRYQLPVHSDVKLEIFDLLGRRVAVLVHGQQPAGTHTIHFDGSNLSSGTYIYRLQTDGFFEVRKMTLIK